jgi:hypothetical protein
VDKENKMIDEDNKMVDVEEETDGGSQGTVHLNSTFYILKR